MQQREDALLCTQRALLDAVTPELRAVAVDIDNENYEFYIRFYYNGEASEKLLDLWSCAITEASAGLDPIYDLNDGIERIDYPNHIPLRGKWAYYRKE